MYENINNFLKDKEFNDSLKTELYSEYIKYREENREDKKQEDNLFLLINVKNETELQKECNGLIFEKKTNKIVCAAYPDFENNLLSQDNLTSVEFCEDGTVLRLYNYKNKWRTATKKCINAAYSHWSSPISFDTMFWNLFNSNDLEKLDVNKTYIFILLHTENVVVVKHTTNKLVYTGSIDNLTYEIDNTFIFNDNEYISKTSNIQKELIDFENNNFESFFNPLKRGLILKFKIDNSFKYYKYDFTSFNYVKDIRGNVPFIRTRFLELLSTPDKLNELVKYYPEYEMTYSMIEHNLQLLSTEIYHLYRNSHVKHVIKIQENDRFFRTIKQLHGQYKKTNTPITKLDVYNKLRSLNYNILKAFFDWV